MEKRRLVLRRKEVVIKEGDYEGWQFTAVVNPPLRVIEDLGSGEISQIVKGLAKVLVPPWNFVDENGDPFPDPSEDVILEFPIDLLAVISKAYSDEVSGLPPQ